ncbi:hypothetical protein [Azohydromonas aeria]|uniref:hypothetical protein n=1 Tax=Azohydromonas aeria TaxID=2590212 RepID=UPI0012FC9732|nr:hypothetical protein [Azohydromonas aeria]
MAVAALLWLPLLLAPGPAAAATSGFTPGGADFIVGGQQPQDDAVLRQRRGQYSLLVLTAARAAGGGLATVRLRVLDARRRVVFSRVLPEPWLLIDLPAGHYEVEAASQGQVQRQPVTIVSGDHQAMVFYFGGAAPLPAD